MSGSEADGADHLSLITTFQFSAVEAEAYRAAVGQRLPQVPSGIVMRLFARKDVRDWLERQFGALTPIHLQQNCDIFGTLDPGHTYQAEITCIKKNANVLAVAIQLRSASKESVAVIRSKFALGVPQENRNQ